MPPRCIQGRQAAPERRGEPTETVMKPLRSSLISLACTLAAAVLLVACGHPASAHASVDFGGGAISLKNGSVVIKLRGHDTARVDAQGQLRIGGQVVATPEPARALLGRYNSLARDLAGQALDLGLDGADFALHTVGQVFRGVLNGSADRAGREAERGGEAIKAQAMALCQGVQEWKLAQDAAAEAVPEFRPYAVISARSTRDCYAEDGAPKAEPERQIAS